MLQSNTEYRKIIMCSHKLFASLLLVAAYFDVAMSVRCFDCNSVNNSMCLDPRLYDRESIMRFLPSVDCQVGVMGRKDFFCRKISQTILRKGHEAEVRVTRGCGWVKDPKNRACYKADNDDHLETVCQCSTDDCNSAETRRVSLWSFVSAFSVLGLIKHILF